METGGDYSGDGGDDLTARRRLRTAYSLRGQWRARPRPIAVGTVGRLQLGRCATYSGGACGGPPSWAMLMRKYSHEWCTNVGARDRGVRGKAPLGPRARSSVVVRRSFFGLPG